MSRFSVLDLASLAFDVDDGEEEADMSEESWVVKARVVEEEISLPLSFLGRGMPYREASFVVMLESLECVVASLLLH